MNTDAIPPFWRWVAGLGVTFGTFLIIEKVIPGMGFLFAIAVLMLIGIKLDFFTFISDWFARLGAWITGTARKAKPL